jgi:tripartite-type tricarboxylate transporter receptor subunit TctC
MMRYLPVTAVMMLLQTAAFAQGYPLKPIRIIVPYPPGSAPDFTAREVGALYSKSLGQQVVIDTRPGAAATLGHAIAAKAQPDGYTLLLATTGGMVSGPALVGDKIPYDPLKDFAMIGLATYVPYSLVVTGGLAARNVKELIDLAKASPGKLNVASPGVGTPNHLGAAQLMTMTGIEMVHVPYTGGSLAITDLLAGNVQVLADDQSGVYRLVASGALAGGDLPGVVAGLSRYVEQAPDYLLIGASGVNGIVGGPSAGVSLVNGQLALVVSRPAEGTAVSGGRHEGG